MTNLEQAKRLKDAGFPQGKSEYSWQKSEWGNGMYRNRRFNKILIAKWEIDAPTEKELMEWLAKSEKVNLSQIIHEWEKDFYYNKHADLTECLVLAVEAVAKGV